MFRFSLEAVLNLRIREVEVAQIALAEEMRRAGDLKRNIDHLAGVEQEKIGELIQIETRGLKVAEYLLRRWHLDGLRARIERLSQDLTRCQEEVANRRQALMEANKKKKMVERLKEKAWQSYQEEERRRERKAVDEFSVLGYARTRGGRSEVSQTG
ncbi:MAG: flagellar export protein FliJ [Deltaproteobacteria bacterium]|nr:flagellar export protein FliJ [Deltaproteobacteria bacterium]